MPKEKGKRRPKPNRKHKDTVFVDLFDKDRDGEKNFRSLYKALFNKELDLDTPVRSIHIENVLYTNLATDVSYLVDNKIIFIAEHQSTINENMPLRCLSYISKMYDQLIEFRKRYRKKGIKIQRPEFYVFYNGREDYPVRKTLKLSDAFMEDDHGKNTNVSLELMVEVVNINREKGNEVLEKCKVLREYSLFVESVRRNRLIDPENGFEKAIEECMEAEILSEYLERKSKEVRNMLTAEYDYATDIAVQREEEREIALQEGISQGMKQGMQKGIYQGMQKGKEENSIHIVMNMVSKGLDIQTISEFTDLDISEVKKIKENFS